MDRMLGEEEGSPQQDDQPLRPELAASQLNNSDSQHHEQQPPLQHQTDHRPIHHGNPPPPHHMSVTDTYSTLYMPSSDFSNFSPPFAPSLSNQSQLHQVSQRIVQHQLSPVQHQTFQQIHYPQLGADISAAPVSSFESRMQAPPPPHPSQHHQTSSALPQANTMQQQALPPLQNDQQQISQHPDQLSREQGPPAFQGSHDGQKYRLVVRQEPIRARMCGFGDKDRRPITPPPCVLLEVLDEKSGEHVDINELDPTYFVMTVDLWSADGLHEVNLVRHSATSPSISATTASSYPPQPLPPGSFPFGQPMGMTGQHPPPYGYGQTQGHPHAPPPGPHGQPGGAPHDPYGQQQHGQYAPSYPNDPNRAYYSNSSTPMTPTHPAYQNGGGQMLSPGVPPMMITQDPRSAPTGMFTRNLIGSLSVSAFKLTNTDDDLGIWFILQDLSVRTEGIFRLKFSFVNVGVPGSGAVPRQLNPGSAPVLATCFSQPFQVFSAKKFPGVIESTQLSKCFAGQGIKIPIRKDGNGRVHDDDD